MRRELGALGIKTVRYPHHVLACLIVPGIFLTFERNSQRLMRHRIAPVLLPGHFAKVYRNALTLETKLLEQFETKVSGTGPA